MKVFACVQGPRNKVLSVSKDTYWCKYIAAAGLDYEAIAGIAGSHHNVGRVLRDNSVKVMRAELTLLEPVYTGRRKP